MKICLISEYFYPNSTGGTEKYVFELAKRLILENNEVEILTVGPIELGNYVYKGILVNVISSTENLVAFENILKNGNYDCLHFHTLTPSFNTRHIALGHLTNAEVYFTAHIPAVTCIHGDLMQFGKVACDGLIIKHRCTACYISKKNLLVGASKLLASVINQVRYPKSIAQAVNKKLEEVLTLNRLCNKIFIFTDWQKIIFIKNGFDPLKLIQIQQMEVLLPTNTSYSIVPKEANKIKIGFAGRVSYEKGLHILLEAFLTLDTDNLELHIAAVIQNKEEPYFQKIINLSNGRPNIFWTFNLNQSSMHFFYQEVDLICIPSIWYETGPYVLYEAFNYKLPVIANNLGDMSVWKKKGYHIQLFNGLNDLKILLKTINDRAKSFK